MPRAAVLYLSAQRSYAYNSRREARGRGIMPSVENECLYVLITDKHIPARKARGKHRFRPLNLIFETEPPRTGFLPPQSAKENTMMHIRARKLDINQTFLSLCAVIKSLYITSYITLSLKLFHPC